MRILLAVLPSFIPFSVHAESLGELSASPYGRDGILIHQSRSIICTAQGTPINRTAPPSVWFRLVDQRAIARQ